MSIQELANFSNYGTPSNTNDKVKICDYKTDLIFYERNPQMLGAAFDRVACSNAGACREWASFIRRNIRGCQ